MEIGLKCIALFSVLCLIPVFLPTQEHTGAAKTLVFFTR